MGLEPVDTEKKVPLSKLIATAIDIYQEWQLVEQALQEGEIPASQRAQALAYQEGILTALRLFNEGTGVSIESMDPAARRQLGVEDPDRRTLKDEMEEDDHAGFCDDCGGELRWEMGFSEPFCPECD